MPRCTVGVVRSRRTRAYTIVEVALVLFLIGVLSATSVYMLGGQRVQGSDALAQTTADAAVDAAIAVLQSEGSLQNASVQRLGIEQPDVTFVSSTTASSGAAVASVMIANGVVAAAVRSDDTSCWMIRASILGDSSQPLRRYVLSPAGSTRDCSGARAFETSALSASGGKGDAWRAPIVWGDTSATVSSEAFVLLRARNFTAGAQTIRNEGSGGSALDGVLGASTAVDSGDPVFLPYDGQTYAYFPGGSGNVASTPSSALNTVTTGQLDVRARIQLTSWTSGVQAIAGKWQPGSNRGWLFAYDGAQQRLVFYASADGVTQTTSTASASFSPAAGKAYWVRMSRSGTSLTFQWAPDQGSEPTTWSQVGSTQSTAASFFSSTLPLSVGAEASGLGTTQLVGRVYQVFVRTGTSSGVAAGFDPSSCASDTRSCTGKSSETWTVTRASAGAQVAIVSRPMFLFSSTSTSFVRIASNAGFSIPSGQAVTVVVVARVHTTPANSHLISRLDPSTSSTAGWNIQATSTQYQLQSKASSGGAAPLYATASNVYTPSKSSVFVSRYESVFGRVTSWTDTSKVSGTGIATPWGALSSSLPVVVGASATAATPADGADMELYAVAIFTRALSDTEVARISSELAV